MEYLPIKTAKDIFWILMVGLFVLTYILVNEVVKYRAITITFELLITAAFAYFSFNFYLIIFPAWQVSFILARYPREYYRIFAISYYLIIAISFFHLQMVYQNVWQQNNMMGMIFPLVSPIIAYSFALSLYKQRQLNQTNRRLEAIIRRGERERIARDLHDTLGQSFSMITIKTELAKKLLVKKPEKVAAELADIENTSRQNLQMVRKIVNNLHKQSLSEVLLNQNKNLSAANILFFSKAEEQASEWPTVVQDRFGAAIVEAISNILRHAKAHEVQLIFSDQADFYQVEVIDDGKGGDFNRENSNGIKGMQARMFEGNGSFKIYHDKHGTHVLMTQAKVNGHDY
ncbi:Signal transduction histidine kinase [Liquorilactobacillus vini DSM 20605]|uniref:histidine kinase n=2 Tax=Liquorilactobacillus vini TaxID=238015 RepID=A0A0R2C013_9LACO|nr:Signal transduction histidine kinase [Liquorilactobacillus vini DSM 20605]